ncbi:hypothetical protein [Streptomyces chartreusis]|uniref:hypothetical protein n=1 Tax=Streptomyces chartreusis TaxID=1969 RepID=UPI0033B20E48
MGTPADDFRKSLSDAGYTWDSISAGALLDTGNVRSGRLLSHSTSYKALVVHDEASLPAETAERIVKFARAGLPIVVQGSVPAAGTSLRSPATEDARVKAAVATLRTLSNVRFVTDPAATAAALARPERRGRHRGLDRE